MSKRKSLPAFDPDVPDSRAFCGYSETEVKAAIKRIGNVGSDNLLAAIDADGSNVGRLSPRAWYHLLRWPWPKLYQWASK